jgi:nicotinamidase-related amidase
VIPPINRLIGAARAAGVPVVYVLMEHGPAIDLPNYQARYFARGMDGDILCAAGTWGARLDGEIATPAAGDLTIVRHSYDAFAGTPLHESLRARGVESVVGAGVVTNLCVQTTIQHAFALGYYVVVAEDATAAVDPTVQAVTLNNFRLYFGPVVPSETIDRHWAPAHDSRVRGAAPA